MQDARAFTSYEPNCQLNERVKARYAPGASSEYRYWLQQNACGMMKQLREEHGFVNPTGCQCNYNHPPHSAEYQKRYHWQPTATWLGNRNRRFNEPIHAPGGRWTNFC